MTEPLPQLLERARAGDETARDRLFDRCRNYVNVVARAEVESWMRAKVDASDLVQQTMMEAHQEIDKFRGNTEAEWLAWLRRILSNNAIDFVRHYKGTAKRAVAREVRIDRMKPGGSLSAAFELTADIESPSELVMRKEREIAVADAIAQLSADHQEVIMLRNLQRLPFDEVAKRMERSRPAVQMLWARALKALQQVLESSDASTGS